jgi:hypothetical protein
LIVKAFGVSLEESEKVALFDYLAGAMAYSVYKDEK